MRGDLLPHHAMTDRDRIDRRLPPFVSEQRGKDRVYPATFPQKYVHLSERLFVKQKKHLIRETHRACARLYFRGSVLSALAFIDVMEGLRVYRW